MTKLTPFTLASLLLMPLAALQAAEPAGTDPLRAEFANPPFSYHSRPLWFWNGKLDTDKTRAMVAACKAAGYYGMGCRFQLVSQFRVTPRRLAGLIPLLEQRHGVPVLKCEVVFEHPGHVVGSVVSALSANGRRAFGNVAPGTFSNFYHVAFLLPARTAPRRLATLHASCWSKRSTCDLGYLSTRELNLSGFNSPRSSQRRIVWRQSLNFVATCLPVRNSSCARAMAGTSCSFVLFIAQPVAERSAFG